MSIKPVSLGPWSGVDNVHSPDASTFQPPGELEKRLAALVAAPDVDIDDDGWPASRLPATTDTVLVSGRGGWSVGGRTFFQDGNTLYERLETDTALITGLSARAMLAEHWGRTYVTDGVQHWELDGQTVRDWGLPVPVLTLYPGNGALTAGTYLVQAAFVDAQGNEGGTSDIASASLTSATGIVVELAGASPRVVGVNLYVSRRDQKQTSWLATVQLGSFPYQITMDDVTAADPPKTEQMTGPISEAAGLFSFRAFLLMWRDSYVFRSEAAEPHLFHGDNMMQFGATVTSCEGVAGGMWIGTAKGLWWVQGDDPDKWVPIRKTFDAVSRGSTRIQGQKMARLQTDDLVALFVTESGLVAGLPNGNVLALTDGVYTFNPAQRASIAYAERDNLRQLFVGMVD